MIVKKFGIELDETDRVPKVVEEEMLQTSRQTLCEPEDVFLFCKNSLHLDRKAEEYVYLFCLNIRGKVIGIYEVAHGGVSTAQVSVREICVRAALTAGAVTMILIHNHPSTFVEPSAADEAITRRIREAGAIINIQLLDSIIIGGDNYYSFKEQHPEYFLNN
ncbi:MAG: JAB domain-containing protein [Lachnospiraceae bacterium]|nr:JAB domain-containing protein [Lachnospiraceae bacterium]